MTPIDFGNPPKVANKFPASTRPQGAAVVELDVRDDLRAGREPLSRIIETVAGLPPDQMLHLRATFEPVPLFNLLGKRGFAHEAVAHTSDDWSIWFWRPDTASDAPPAAAAAAKGTGDTNLAGNTAGGSAGTSRAETSSAGAGAAAESAGTPPAEPESDVVEIDVRGLEPPEPLMRTLAALETLPRGHTLLHINSRVPQLLFPMLAERGFGCDVDESVPDRILVRIRHLS